MKTQDFYGTAPSAWRRTLARVAATGAVLTLAACQTNVTHERSTATIFGRVAADGTDAPLVVLAFERGSGRLAQRAVLETQRAFSMRLRSGAYRFYACADENRDGHCAGSERRSVTYSLADELHAGDIVQLPSFRLGARQRVTAAG
jgi:hypothetical protein